MRYRDQYRHRVLGIIQFNNGNLNIRIPKGDLEVYLGNQVSYLSEMLWEADCQFVGDTFCLGNWATGHLIYNSHKDCCYIFPWNELETLADGKTVKLYAFKPDTDQKEIIEKED